MAELQFNQNLEAIAVKQQNSNNSGFTQQAQNTNKVSIFEQNNTNQFSDYSTSLSDYTDSLSKLRSANTEPSNFFDRNFKLLEKIKSFKEFNEENNTSTFSVEYPDGGEYKIHYNGNKTEYSEIIEKEKRTIIDNIGRPIKKIETIDDKSIVSNYSYLGDSPLVKEIIEEYSDDVKIFYSNGLKTVQNGSGIVSIENDNRTIRIYDGQGRTVEPTEVKESSPLEDEAKEIANNLHNILYSSDSDRISQILKVMKNSADPANINFIIDEYKNLTGGRDLQSDINSISGYHFLKKNQINKMFDELLHFENLDSKVNNEYYEGDSHSIVRDGSTFTITNKETNETREIDLSVLLKDVKTAKERKELVEKLQKMPGEVLMDLAAEQTSILMLEGDSTEVSVGNNKTCKAAGYYTSGDDQIAIHGSSSISTIIHELGHALDYNKESGSNLSSATQDEKYLELFNKEMEKYLAAGNKRYVYGEYEKSGTYATANEREMFAECYTLIMTGHCNSEKVIKKYFPEMLNYVKEVVERNRNKDDKIRH